MAAMRVEDVQELVHELQVHQIELDMQNEELRRTQLELAGARDRYLDLYRVGTVAYFTLDAGLVIRAANLTATALFAVERTKLLGRRFLVWVAKECRNPCRESLRRAVDSAAKEVCNVWLVRPDGSRFFGRFRSRRGREPPVGRGGIRPPCVGGGAARSRSTTLPNRSRPASNWPGPSGNGSTPSTASPT